MQLCKYVIHMRPKSSCLFLDQTGIATQKPGVSLAAFQWRVPLSLNGKTQMLEPMDLLLPSKCCSAEQWTHHHGPTHSLKLLMPARECLEENGYMMAMPVHRGRLMRLRRHQVHNQVRLQVLKHLMGERGNRLSRLLIGASIGILNILAVPRLPRV